jgi:hypothetical protein
MVGGQEHRRHGVGAAAQAGLLDPAAPRRSPEWQSPGDPRARITTDQLLRMASGLHSDAPATAPTPRTSAAPA